ncbi:unnamed protein product [Clavelina lepadiformis]|uniref:Uncharacterized protein n=1 Tax=Clavelina lepadiformis TaxID=159417 RepID=A0ABP0FBM6_CLALP
MKNHIETKTNEDGGINDAVVSVAIAICYLYECNCKSENLSVKVYNEFRRIITYMESLQPTTNHLQHQVDNMNYALARMSHYLGQRSKSTDKGLDRIDVVALTTFQKAILLDNIEHQVYDIQQCSNKISLTDKKVFERSSPIEPDLLVLLQSASDLFSHLSNLHTDRPLGRATGTSFLTLVKSFAKNLENLVKLLSAATAPLDIVGENQVTTNHVWNVKSALNTATNLLTGYNEATKYLLSCLLHEKVGFQTIEKCITSLSKHPECCFRTQHICSLCQLLFLLQTKEIDQVDYKNPDCVHTSSHLISCLKDLLVQSFEHLPLRSKVALLQNIYENFNMQHYFQSAFEWNSDKDCGKHQQKVTFFFNTLTRSSTSVNTDNLLQSLCNVAFIGPKLTIRKLVEQVVYHEEHHSILCDALCKLQFLLQLGDSDDESFFLKCLCDPEFSHKEDNISANQCQFIALLLNAENNLSSDLVQTIVRRLFQNHVLKPLDNESCLKNEKNAEQNKSLGLCLKLLEHVFQKNETLFRVISLFDICCLIYLLARLFDVTELSGQDDGYVVRVKQSLMYMVEMLEKQLRNRPEDTACHIQWLQHATSCLRWSTQMYLYFLFSSQNNHYWLTIPKSIESVCLVDDNDKIKFKTCYGEGSGLTAWLQSIIAEKCLFPTTSLRVVDLTMEERDMFVYGMILSLAQVLPHCMEGDWNAIMQAMTDLIRENYLPIPYPAERFQYLPLLNIKTCSISLSIAELLHRVILIISSPSCAHWMKEPLWTRFAKCYAITVKGIIDTAIALDLDNLRREQFFMLSQLFLYSCDFICLLESGQCTETACNSVFVLSLDLLNTLSKIFQSLPTKTSKEDEVEVEDLLKRDIFYMKPLMLSSVECISNDKIEDALVQKLLDLV